MVALVTGAGLRIGRALALSLAKLGHDVAVHYAGSVDAAEATANDIRSLGRKAVTLQADLLNEAEAAQLVDRASAALGGPVLVLVNNASIFEYDTITSATHESWNRHMGSNFRAPFVLTQKMAGQVPAPDLDANGEPVAKGLVINMIDQRVRKLTPEFMTYTLAKMGLWALTQTAAQALAPNVRVNAIGPGPTIRGVRQSETHFAKQRAATILERGADADGIAQALKYFHDAPSVTGQLLCVDGGQHLAWQTPDVLGLE
ncbi:MAG: NAD(P)-dependent dehydrogenase (short-subunit alcohol dehydrogenase family) [Paracoccaceae bacterium]|jgi:NAD(P)-dependent dehydrogenase (short-subunit alcohol dehydrogenase family)